MAEDQKEPEIGRVRAITAIVIGFLSGLIGVILPYAIGWGYLVITTRSLAVPFTTAAGFNVSLTVLFPFVQGAALGVAMGPEKFDFTKTFGLIVILMMAEIFGAFVFLREGVICLIVASPLLLAMMASGAVVGRMLARRKVSRTLQVSLIPFIVLGVLGEAIGPKPDHASVVADTVVINAPAEYVWRYVASYPENKSPPEYWLWRAGLPEPIQSMAEAPRVGAKRVCWFKGGLGFEERITELKPNEVMTFVVTKQPDHPEVVGHFQFDQGQIRLTPNANGTTTVTATSWYRLFVRPAAYFDWWTADITRQVHFRVLNHIKRLAERDYGQAPAQP